MEGVSLQASPSTCIGIVFVVMMRADLHWVMQVPWPPACSRGCNTVGIRTQIPVITYAHMYYLHSSAFSQLSLFYKERLPYDTVIFMCPFVHVHVRICPP
jgi:hypothetical protein